MWWAAFQQYRRIEHTCSCIAHVRLECITMEPLMLMLHYVHAVHALYAEHLNVVTSPLRLSLACPQCCRCRPPFAPAMPSSVVRLHVLAFCLQAAGTDRHPFCIFLHIYASS